MRAEYQFLYDSIRAELGKVNKFTAETMAHAVHRAVEKEAVRHGQNPKVETFIRKPGEPRHFGDATCWCVAWEAGPYEWAVGACDVISDVTKKLVEPYYSFDICFYPGEDARA